MANSFAYAQREDSPRIQTPGAETVENKFCDNVKIGAGVKMTKKRAKNEKFYSIFFKKSREWKGQSPFPGAHFPYFRS